MNGNGKAPASRAATITLERMPISALRPGRRNPKTMDPEARGALGESLGHFGYVDTIVYNRRTGRLVNGHQRVAELRERGFTEVDVSVVDVDEAEEEAMRIALDNRKAQGRFNSGVGEMLDDLREPLGETFSALRFDELLPATHDEVATVEERTGPVRASFWLTVRGPLPAQPDVLERLREVLGELEGVVVAGGATIDGLADDVG